MSHWTYTFRTCPDIALLLSPLKSTIHTVQILLKTSQPPPNDDMRSLFSQPCHHGGLGILIPTESSLVHYHNSVIVTSPLVDLVLVEEETKEICKERERSKLNLLHWCFTYWTTM